MDDWFGWYANTVAWGHLIAFLVLTVWWWALCWRYAGALGLTLGFIPVPVAAWFVAFPVGFLWPLAALLIPAIMLGSRRPRAAVRWRETSQVSGGKNAWGH